MAKTSYIIIVNPAYDFIDADNPEKAEEAYRKSNPKAKDVAVVPKNWFKLNGKRISYKPALSTQSRHTQ